MRLKFKGTYPDNWDVISEKVKDRAGWRCVRCGHKGEFVGIPMPCDSRCDRSKHAEFAKGGDGRQRQRVLTVHHLDNNKSNIEWWNLVALCQVCHLIIQGKIKIEQMWMFKHSDWIKPYVAGYYANIYGYPTEERWVMDHVEDLLIIGNRHKNIEFIRKAHRLLGGSEDEKS